MHGSMLAYRCAMHNNASMMTKIPDLIGTAEAAALLGIDRTSLTRRVQRGHLIPAARLSGSNGALVFDRATIAALAARS